MKRLSPDESENRSLYSSTIREATSELQREAVNATRSAVRELIRRRMEGKVVEVRRLLPEQMSGETISLPDA